MTSPSLNYGSDSLGPVPRRRPNAGQVQGRIAQPHKSAQPPTGSVNQPVQTQAVNANPNPIASQTRSSATQLMCCIIVVCVFVFACTAIIVGCVVYFNGKMDDEFKQMKWQIIDIKRASGLKEDVLIIHDETNGVNQNDQSKDRQSRDSFGRKLEKVGKEIEKGAKNAGKAIEKEVKNAGKEIEKGVKNAGKEIEKGFKKIIRFRL